MLLEIDDLQALQNISKFEIVQNYFQFRIDATWISGEFHVHVFQALPPKPCCWNLANDIHMTLILDRVLNVLNLKVNSVLIEAYDKAPKSQEDDFAVLYHEEQLDGHF